MLTGCDISSWDDAPSTPTHVDFNKMKNAGGNFVFVKAGQGLLADRDIKINMQNSKGIIPRGTYWYYDNRYNPSQQAQSYASVIADDAGELPLVVDIEDRQVGSFSGWGNWYNFITKLQILVPAKEIVIYTAPAYWKEFTIYCPQISLNWFKRYSLWIANYRVSKPVIPPPFTDWLFWQYTDSDDGIAFGCEAKEVDLNYFNGDQNAFDLRFHTDTSVPVEVTPDFIESIVVKYKSGKIVSIP